MRPLRFHLVSCSVLAVLLAAGLGTPEAQPADLPRAELNAPGDAGPAVIAQAPTAASTKNSSVQAATAPSENRFPLRQEAFIHTLGGGVRGFGLLAEYPAPGPRAVLIRRTTRLPQREPYTPTALLRVFAPNGDLLAHLEMTEQSEPEATYELAIPQGPAGIYRLSVSGGRQHDRFEVGLPETAIWGIRGEMALGLSNTLPSRLWLMAPRTVERIYLEQFGAAGKVARLLDAQGNELGAAHRNERGRHLLTLKPAPADALLQVDLDGLANRAIAFDGIPGLLCPTPEAARRLAGGTLEAEGLLVAGPLQARARARMLALLEEDLDPKLAWLEQVPADLDNPQLEALAYGKYAPLSSLNHALPLQILDPKDPYLGTFQTQEARANRPDWQRFLHGGIVNFGQATSLANGLVLPTRLNPAQDNPALLRRALLVALYHITSLQGDDLIREGTFSNNSYPITHAFFAYPGAFAEPLHLIGDRLDAETRALWIQGLMAVGDKLADHQAYQSNQWSHVIQGHLLAFLVTGEKRFLGYFERAARAFLSGAWGANAKFGQHPAGYYLEEFGPDGNYDHLSSFSIVSAYRLYRDLPQADPELITAFHTGIERNLTFKSFYWLPQPSGRFGGVNAFNCRTNGMIHSPSYPGDYLASRDFPLALRRFQMTPTPAAGEGNFARIFPHVINNDAWARRTLQVTVPAGGSLFEETWIGGGWTHALYAAYQEPITFDPAPLPIDAENGLWELPGHIAFKRGPLYGTVFYDVAGTGQSRQLPGRFGGGPTVLWTAETGQVLGAMQARNRLTLASPQDMTHSGVYGQLEAEEFFASGRERSQLQWIEPQRVFEITSQLQQPGGELSWRYTLEADALMISVRLTAQAVRTAWVNLPVRDLESQAALRLSGPDQVIYELGDATVTFTRLEGPTPPAEDTHAPSLHLSDPLPASHGHVRAIRVPLAADGSPTTLRITTSHTKSEHAANKERP